VIGVVGVWEELLQPTAVRAAAVPAPIMNRRLLKALLMSSSTLRTAIPLSVLENLLRCLRAVEKNASLNWRIQTMPRDLGSRIFCQFKMRAEKTSYCRSTRRCRAWISVSKYCFSGERKEPRMLNADKSGEIFTGKLNSKGWERRTEQASRSHLSHNRLQSVFQENSYARVSSIFST